MKIGDRWAIEAFYAIVFLNLGTSFIGYRFGFWLGVATAFALSLSAIIWLSRIVALSYRQVGISVLLGEIAAIVLMALSNLLNGLSNLIWELLWFMIPALVSGTGAVLVLWTGPSHNETISWKDVVKKFHVDKIWIMIGIFILTFIFDSFLEWVVPDGDLLIFISINGITLYLVITWTRMVDLDQAVGYVFGLSFLVLVWMDKGTAISAKEYSFLSFSETFLYFHNVPSSRLFLTLFLLGFAFRIKSTGWKSLFRLTSPQTTKNKI